MTAVEILAIPKRRIHVGMTILLRGTFADTSVVEDRAFTMADCIAALEFLRNNNDPTPNFVPFKIQSWQHLRLRRMLGLMHKITISDLMPSMCRWPTESSSRARGSVTPGTPIHGMIS